MSSSKQSSRSNRRRILREVLGLPTAPFAEHNVVDYIKRFCEKKPGVAVQEDRAGNLLVRVRRGRALSKVTLCITAHMDHPGFVADRMVGPNTLRAFWRGGVPPEYFVGSKVRFFVDRQGVRGQVRSIRTALDRGNRRVQSARIQVSSIIPKGSVGMWDLPDPVIRGTKIHARACDDLVGVASLLACMDALSNTPTSCDARFLFTRAEEVGFVGAIAAAKGKTIPKSCLVISVETSSRRPNAKPGEGPILRVGDKTSTFTSSATDFCRQVADDLAKHDKRFKYQRRLMDGGTCESSAFCQLGYQATGVCVALGNYHNVDTKRRRIAPEYIDLGDFDRLVTWFIALATTNRRYSSRNETFDIVLKNLERQHAQLLRASKNQPC
ncbi:MAG: M28 family peptidase [Planctomycetota bacterium]